MDFRPWMVQTASGFIQGARLLWENRLCSPSMVNAAIGLEILFKSFCATVDGPSTGIGEQYAIVGGDHNLLRLFDAIPMASRERLGFQPYRGYFEGRAGDLFVLARYPYERGGLAGGSSAIIEVAENMLAQVIREYKRSGCTDPWIVAYPKS